MSQSDFGNLSSPLSGTDFINNKLEPWRDSIHTSHSGSSRPSYVQAGMVWLDTNTTPWVYKLYDGAGDISIGRFNPTSDTFEPFGVKRWGGTVGGTANAITLTPDIALLAYEAGDGYDFLVTNANTAEAPTVNVSSLGTKTIKCSVGAGKVNLPIGALQPGMIARIVYDGTDFLLVNIRPHNKSANIATASTINLDNASGDYVLLTGTTTVTGVTLGEGVRKLCRAQGIFTLTNGASLLLPGSANIITEADDLFELVGEASGVVRLTEYYRKSGLPLIGSVGCSLVQASAQSIPNNAFTALTFGSGSENWDDNNYHDVTTNNSRITPGVIGRGQFIGQVTLSTTGAITKSLKLYKNGSPTTAEFRNATNADSGGHVLQVIHEDSFNATDYYELFTAHVTGSAVNTLAAGTTFIFRRTR